MGEAYLYLEGLGIVKLITLATNMAHSTMSATSRPIMDWSFTQVGGGEGTKDGEWLQVSSFPTTVHVELLNLNRIPDPVCLFPLLGRFHDDLGIRSLVRGSS